MNRTFYDLASLAARMGVGGIFFANGWEKLEAGLTATGGQFARLGAPMPGLWAAAAMLIELVGGTLLITGLAVSIVGLLLFAEAVAVFVLAAGDTGLPLTGGSLDLIISLGAASVLLAVGGAGRVSVDHMVVIKRREAEDTENRAADAEADAVIAALREPSAPIPAKTTTRSAAKSPTGSATGSASTESATATSAESTTVQSTTGESIAGESASAAKGPVTFPASSRTSSDADDTRTTVTKPRSRRTRKGNEGNPQNPEKAEHPEKPENVETGSKTPLRPERGDTLVAGRRTTDEPSP